MSNTGKRVDMLRQAPAGKWYASRLLQLWNRNGRDSELSVDDVEQMVIQLRSPHADMADTILQADEMCRQLKWVQVETNEPCACACGDADQEARFAAMLSRA